MEWSTVISLTPKTVARKDAVSVEAQDLTKIRDGPHCFMLRRKQSSANIPICFDHAWVIPPSLFDGHDMDPPVCYSVT